MADPKHISGVERIDNKLLVSFPDGRIAVLNGRNIYEQSIPAEILFPLPDEEGEPGD